jgi:hypothetical protein
MTGRRDFNAAEFAGERKGWKARSSVAFFSQSFETLVV